MEFQVAPQYFQPYSRQRGWSCFCKWRIQLEQLGFTSLWIGDSTVTGRYSQSRWHDYKACRACRRMNGFGSQVSMTWYELMRSRTTIVTIVSVAWTCSQVLDSKIPGDAQWVKGASHGGPARRSHPRGLRCSSEPGRVARHQNLGATQHI
jgi:hypothetical protein